MLARLLPLWEEIRTGLWFLPTLMSLGAVALAWFALSVSVDAPAPESWWLHGGDAKDAFQLLSNLLTALITMTTLALSITMVVLTLAAAQLGPRLIRRFMSDWRTQSVLGLFIGTIVYLVLVLRTLHGEVDDENVPRVAVTLGTSLVLICVFALLYFVHHLARSIVADTMIQRVGSDLDEAIRAHTDEPGEAPDEDHEPLLPTEDMPSAVVRLARGGYLQSVDLDTVVAQARRERAIVGFDFRPGHHALSGCVLARVWPPAAITEALRSAITEAVVIGDARTAAQDVEFSVRQLVEIALRALSTGVNDPHTANAVLDRLGRALALVMARRPMRRAWRDQDGVVRVHAHFPDFQGIVNEALNEIRQAAVSQPAVLIHLLVTLDQLAAQARNHEQRHVLREHVRMVGDAGRRTINEPCDLAALEAPYKSAMAQLAGDPE